jgi:hypothetical protein
MEWMKKDIVQKVENEMLPCYGRIQRGEGYDLPESCTDHTNITVTLKTNSMKSR